MRSDLTRRGTRRVAAGGTLATLMILFGSSLPASAADQSWTVEGHGATATGTTVLGPGGPLVHSPREFTSTGRLQAGGTCVSAWVTIGPFPGAAGAQRVASVCGTASAPVAAEGAVSGASPGSRAWLVVCEGATRTACGTAVAIA